VLEKRGHGQRVRAAAEFALEFGSVTASMVPLACAVALESRRRLVLGVPPLMVIAVVFSVSRSPMLGLAAGGLAWVALSRFERRAVGLAVLAAIAVGLLYVTTPVFRHPFQAAPSDSAASRTRRAQFVGASVLPHVDTGLGFGGLQPLGLGGTDSTFVWIYGTLGVVGLVGLVSILIVPISVSSVGAIRDRGPDNLFGAAAAAGLVASVVGVGAYDALQGPSASWTIWLLAALGVVAAEGAGSLAVVKTRRSPVRPVWPAIGVIAGLLWASTVSPRFTVTSTFNTLRPDTVGLLGGVGQVVIGSICADGRAALHVTPVRVTCWRDGLAGTSAGRLEISGSDSATVNDALLVFDQQARQIDAPYQRAVVAAVRNRSTPARTAPFWLGLVGALLALLLPPMAWRSRRATLRRRTAVTRVPDAHGVRAAAVAFAADAAESERAAPSGGSTPTRL
jgi:hypothetical protein